MEEEEGEAVVDDFQVVGVGLGVGLGDQRMDDQLGDQRQLRIGLGRRIVPNPRRNQVVVGNCMP